MARVTTSLNDFPEHQAIIGRLVVSYSELEIDLIGLVAIALSIPLDDSVRLIFRARSESHRISLADAALRPFFAKEKLSGPYSQFFGAIKRCKDIRNQYAHSIWDRLNGIPCFASLDTAAQTTEGEAGMTFRAVGLELLRRQEKLFVYTERTAQWLKLEARFRRDRRRKHKYPLPKASPLPKLHNQVK